LEGGSQAILNIEEENSIMDIAAAVIFSGYGPENID